MPPSTTAMAIVSAITRMEKTASSGQTHDDPDAPGRPRGAESQSVAQMEVEARPATIAA